MLPHLEDMLRDTLVGSRKREPISKPFALNTDGSLRKPTFGNSRRAAKLLELTADHLVIPDTGQAIK